MTIFFPQNGVDYLRGRLFQILLTEGRALNIIPSNRKLFWLFDQFSMPTSSAPELELSLISFAGSGSTAT